MIDGVLAKHFQSWANALTTHPGQFQHNLKLIPNLCCKGYIFLII